MQTQNYKSAKQNDDEQIEDVTSTQPLAHSNGSSSDEGNRNDQKYQGCQKLHNLEKAVKRSKNCYNDDDKITNMHCVCYQQFEFEPHLHPELQINLQAQFLKSQYPLAQKLIQTNLNIKVDAINLFQSQQQRGTHQRLGIDLMVVLDRSGSMAQDGKLSYVQRTIDRIVQQLTERDRFCLVTFNDNARRNTSFRIMNQQNKQTVVDYVKQLRASGKTDMYQALRKALLAIEERQYQNELLSVILLTDGRDSEKNTEQKIKPLLNQCQADFSLHTFGYGDDIDAAFLKNLAKERHGNFYYVSEPAKIEEQFQDCLNSLMQISMQQVYVEVALQGKDEVSAIRVTDVYDQGFTKIADANGERYQACLHTMKSAQERNLVLKVDVDIEEAKRQESERIQKHPVLRLLKIKKIRVGEVKIRFHCGDGQIYFLKQDIFMNFGQDGAIVQDVLQNILRVRSVQAMENAFIRPQEAQQELDELIDELKRAIAGTNNSLLNMLLKDLKQLRQKCGSCMNAHEFNDFTSQSYSYQCESASQYHQLHGSSQTENKVQAPIIGV